MGEIVTGNFIGPDAEKVTLAELADDVVTGLPGKRAGQPGQGRSFGLAD
jgi:hypothetical protein